MNRPKQPNSPKPYQLVSLPSQSPNRKQPVGHKKLRDDRFHGRISLRLNVKTSSFIASGVVAMGSDLSSQTRNLPLVKLAVESNNQLVIPGSSLKGTIRATYEAMTRSCLCNHRGKRNNNKIPKYYQECEYKKNEKNISQLCPACQVFGAMGWQGLLWFQDAILTEIPTQKVTTGSMPSLYSPSDKRSAYYKDGKYAGRKFYYHAKEVVEEKESRGIPVQNITQNSIFTTKIRFCNLKQEELGTLFTVLGYNKNYPFALKIGGGKPIGMGTLTTEIIEMDCPENVRDRCLSYTPTSEPLTGDALENFITEAIQKAHQTKLIQQQQLQELQQVLTYPTDREAPSGMY
ncbi:hypothetical protein PCC7418_0687 [Halothece sp. PCC 7418]|uniref:RAMP superfamily CRISPR-associated protein n=1 Tax=Halothece sp. (strain PCC 7418) TaxID=65093 RepID=UPI0002A06547|nr:RAMP superfamily CRISPR-associated protein [Halothece sp. PCC 7418]AFZ42908.1 hypothetical protein PCC7418_0687 [Halothece sp. PCC 7418]